MIISPDRHPEHEAAIDAAVRMMLLTGWFTRTSDAQARTRNGDVFFRVREADLEAFLVTMSTDAHQVLAVLQPEGDDRHLFAVKPSRPTLRVIQGGRTDVEHK